MDYPTPKPISVTVDMSNYHSRKIKLEDLPLHMQQDIIRAVENAEKYLIMNRTE